MAEFRLDRIRFTWKGNWSAATVYTKDDIVRYGGKSYVCLVSHTASVNFNTDIDYVNTAVEPDTAEPKWVIWFDGYEFRNNWAPNIVYNVGDLVRYGSIIYACSVAHTSDPLGLEYTISKWTIYAKTDNWLNNWAVLTHYKINDIVKSSGVIYRCNTNHISSGTISNGIDVDLSKWDVVTISEKWLTNWTINTRYQINDTVRYGGIIYKCLTGHLSALTVDEGIELNQINWEIIHNGIDYKSSHTLSVRYKANDLVKYGANIWICLTGHTASITFDVEKWAIYIPGLEFTSNWVNTTEYVPGDIVRYGGYSYTSKTHNNNRKPSAFILDWTLLTAGFKIAGDWLDATQYKIGEVVRQHGQLYVAIEDSISQDPNASSQWELVIPGNNWYNVWIVNTTYQIGDLVRYESSTYSCNTNHVSTLLSSPDINSSVWTLVVEGDYRNPLMYTGDINTVDSTGNISSAVGPESSLLKAGASIPYFESYGVIGYIYYVAPHGNDDPLYGTTLDTPFKTVKYACDFVRSGTQHQNANYLLTSNKNWIIAEMYQWMRYQCAQNISPFTTTTTFDQTKTIRDASLILDCLSYDLSRGGNSQTVTNTYRYFQPGTNTFYNSNVAAKMPIFIAAITQLLSLVQNAIFNLTPTQNYQALMLTPGIINQSINLAYTAELDASDLISDLLSITLTALTSQSLSVIPKITTGLDATIFIKTGTYLEITPIVVPMDTALVGDEIRSTIIQPAVGYEESNMFYVRNGTGIRNMSLKGLYGTLSEYNQYLTKRPSAGAYVSLDPGIGPDDSSVWITTRSPYIQNVTTFGTGCVGLKIDGTLHNGGNKSVVANDFTQVLSDGIGVWCTGPSALVELVSVFSYYGHIGYLAEHGGRIRATNGNSSYGDYGTVAEGYDTTESPLLGTINNQNNEALIASVVAGESQNKILILEYLTAGQNYTTASYSFTGSGTGAIAIADEFRDNAIFENKIYGTEITAGGTGYSTASNHAQSGDTTTITIASNDTNLAANYVGMRIVLTSGTGVGQYGYIYSYDSVGKVITVYNERSGLIGWGHVNSGTPIIAELDSTTVYNIEPRITFASPGYSSSAMSLPSASWSSIAYGNSQFVAVASGGNAVYSVDGFTWVASTGFPSITNPTVAFSNGVFVSVDSASTAYAYSTNGTTWITSAFLSGSTFSNVITAGSNVAVVDYAGSKLLLSSSGGTWASTIATGVLSGKIAYGAGIFVSFASGSTNSAVYSIDAGVTWVAVTLPTTAIWADIKYGNGRFVAIASSGNSVVYSLTGIDWYASTASVSRSWRSLGYGQGLFVAIATGTNSITTSQDGVVWTTQSVSASSTWSAVCFGNPLSVGSFVAVSTSATGRQIFAGATAAGRAVIASGKIGAINIWEPGSGYTTDPTVAQFTASISGTIMTVTNTFYGTLAPGLILGGGKGNITANTTVLSSNDVTFTGFILGTSLTVVSVLSGTVALGMTIDNSAGGTYLASTTTAVFTGTVALSQLTVSTMTSGIIYAGMAITGGSIPAGTFIVSNVSGAGINSKWTLSNSFTQTLTTITGLRYNVSNGQSVGSASSLVSFNGVSYNVSASQTIASANIHAYSAGSPVVTVTAPDATTTVVVTCRSATGVLGNPSFTNRGNNYQTSTTSGFVTGDGFADIPSISKFITVNDLPYAPSPGASIIIAGNSTQFKIVNITSLSGGIYYFQISPVLTRMTAPVHGTAVQIRQRYSQVRLTGHDFLLIGTGNKEQTNFPNTDTTTALAAYQIQENNQGRVFVTATDQDGNFKVGGQFAVQQATGIVTISADLFNLAGLDKITLGGVQIGQNTVTITQFSTDSYFVANSDSIVPTQKAIKAYIARLISSGGANAMTSILNAGIVGVGPQRIFTTTGTLLTMNNNVNFNGNINGTMLALSYFMHDGSVD